MTFRQAPASVYVNGLSLASLGFVLDEASGPADGLERTDQTVELPQGVGSFLGTAQGRVAPRTLVIAGSLLATTQSTLDDAQDAIKAACGAGLVEVRLVTRDVVYRGRLVGLSIARTAPQLRTTNPAARCTLRFLCHDPFAYDRTPNVIGFGSTRVAIPLGTAPSRGRSWWSAIITIAGAATDPTLTYSDAAGNALGTMAFTFDPTVADAIEIDVGRSLVTRIQSGVRDNGLPYLTAGYTFPALDPADGDYATSQWPGLAVSSGSASIRYFRAFA